MTPLTPGELRSLVELAHERGLRRSVRVSRVGRVYTCRTGQVGARDPAVWMRLVARGLVAGGDGKLRLTADGVRAIGGAG